MSSRTPSTGVLYVVATPIGNLADISERARAVLAEVDRIAAEDTRHTAVLLQSIGVAKPMLALHEHNEEYRAQELLAHLQRGEKIALVSDAGTPLISDPGYDVVRTAIENGVRVVPLPGPCAAIAALSVAGLPTDRFVFEGFLPAKLVARRERLSLLAHEIRTLVFYEAPHRLHESLEDIALVLGNERRIVVARELTKQFETVYYGTAQALALQSTQDANMNRGETVIVVEGTPSQEKSRTELQTESVLRALLDELAPAKAAKIAAKLTGASRAECYELAMTIGKRRGDAEKK